MIPWPTNLNHLPEQGSWSYKPVSDNARTDMEAGPARTRRRFTSYLAETDFTVVMSYQEIEIFKAFVADDLYQAAAWFQMEVFVGGEYKISVVRFRDAKNPYETSDDGFDRVKVSMKLEIRGGGQIMSSSTAWIVSEYGDDFVLAWADAIQVAVNTDYPAAV
jgi:hypothetical protein